MFWHQHTPKTPPEGVTSGPQDPASAVRLARLVHGLLVIGLIMFGGVITLVSILTQPAEQPIEKEPLPMALVIAAGAMSATMVLPALMFGSGLVRQVLSKEGLSIAERAQRYVGGHVFLAAMIEGPGLFWGVLALITGDILLLAGLGFSVCALVAVGPRSGEWEDAGFDMRERLEERRAES